MANKLGTVIGKNQDKIPILYVDQSDGSWARRLTIAGGAGSDKYGTVVGQNQDPITIRYVDQLDGTYAEKVDGGGGGGATVLYTPDNTYDIGDATHRPRYVYSGTQFRAADGTAAAPGYAFAADPSTGLYRGGSGRVAAISSGGEQFRWFANNFNLQSGVTLNWNAPGFTENPDLTLRRDAANVLSQRNGANSQIFNIYNTWTSASIYEQGFFGWFSNALVVGSDAAGGGTTRPLRFYVGGYRWEIPLAGHFNASLDNTYDIGASGASRPRNIFVGTNVTVGGQVLLADGTVAAPGYAFASAPNSGFFRRTSAIYEFSIGGASIFSLDAGDKSISLANSGSLQWSNHPTDPRAPLDLKLFRDAAGVLAQRNGVSAQEFRLYNTYTDATNYEALSVGWASNVCTIAPTKGASGVLRELRIGNGIHINFYVAGAPDLVIANGSQNAIWKFSATDGSFLGAGVAANIWMGNAALATTATAGFLGVNSCAGPPTGVPASIPTGQIPLVYDSTNDKLYIYRGGWKTLAAAFA